MSIYIESERLILRQFTEADLPELVNIAKQEHILYWCPDWNDCASWVHDWFKGISWRYTINDPNKEFILLAIIEKSTNQLIGQINTGCELKEERPGELSIGYYISKDKLNKGYATEAAKAMTGHFFPVNPNDFFYAIIKPSNAASHRVAQKAGFRFVSEITIKDKDTGKPLLMHYYRMDNPASLRIETSRLILRPFVDSDAASAAHNSKTLTVAHFMPEMVKDTEEAALGWIRYVNKELWSIDKPCVLFSIIRKADERCIGCIFINRKEKWGNVVEMGYYIGDEYQNSGYATEAGKAMIWWAFEKAGQDVISAFTKPENTASRRVVEKLGFIYAGKRLLPHDGGDCEFDYFRFYHTDHLPGPEWDIRNLYIPEPMAEFFDSRAAGYNDHMLRESGVDDYKKLGNSFPKTDESLSILDIGCGTGIELDHIWAQAPNAHITCVDMSRGMLELLLKNHPDGHHRISIIEASYTDWQYPKEAFDIVVSSMTMHHLQQDEKTAVYRKILSTLKQEGAYIESDFIVDAALSEQYRQRYEMITSALPAGTKAGEYHIDIPFTVEIQRKLLLDAGFQTVEVLDDIINHGRGAILKAVK